MNWFRSLQTTVLDPVAAMFRRVIHRPTPVEAFPRLQMNLVTPQEINSAFDYASRGQFQYLARIYEKMCASDAAVGGAVLQLRAELGKIEWDSLPASTHPEAVRLAAEWDKQLRGAAGKFSILLEAGMNAFLQGMSFCEVIWREDAPAAWRGFAEVPFSLIRRDVTTGAYGFSPTAMSPQSIPFSQFQPGKFVMFEWSPQTVDRAEVGAFRIICEDWFSRRRASTWYNQRLERWGVPGLIGQMDRPEDQERFMDFAQNFGANWSLAVSKNAVVTPAQLSAPVPSIFREQDEITRGNIATAIVGSPQALAVDQKAGSQASVSVFAEVRRAIAVMIFRFIVAAVREQLGIPWARRASTVDPALVTPIMEPRIEDPKEMLAAAQALVEVQKTGARVSEAFAGKLCHVPTPGPNDRVLVPVTTPAAGTQSVLHRLSSSAGLLMDGAPEGIGDEITEPVRKLINKAVEESWDPSRLIVALAQMREPDAPELEDRLAAAWAEGIQTGIQDVRRERKSRLQ